MTTTPTATSTDRFLHLGSSEGYFKRNELGALSNQFYRGNGYIVLVDALNASEVDGLQNETKRICLEEHAVLQRQEAGASTPELTEDEVLRQFLCIHHPQKISQHVYDYLAHESVIEVLTDVIGANVKCMQSMLFIKASGKPGQAWHQDEHFIPTRDRSLTGAWIALDAAVVENGCLWVIPGSHRPGVIWPMYPHEDPRYDCAQMAYDFPYDDDEAVPVEVPAGAAVIFNGYLLHKSEPNKLDGGYRRVLVNHYMSAESLLPWFHPKNLEVPVGHADFRDIVLVAGKDPYAWKGTEDIYKAMVRPSGEGGCGDGRVSLSEYRKQLLEKGAP
jgi:ectoine hydroxylase-related dioxygenase (phytanoyl-CoA dioxygenase family)